MTDGTDEGARKKRAVLAFRVVYMFLVANFLFPAISYIVKPAFAISQTAGLNRTLGGGPWPEESGQLWHMLAVGNVMTLAFMCAMLLYDLRRFYPVLPALVFLKGFSSLYSLALGAALGLPAFYGVFVLDGVTSLAMVFFARRAHAAMTAA